MFHLFDVSLDLAVVAAWCLQQSPAESMILHHTHCQEFKLRWWVLHPYQVNCWYISFFVRALVMWSVKVRVYQVLLDCRNAWSPYFPWNSVFVCWHPCANRPLRQGVDYPCQHWRQQWSLLIFYLSGLCIFSIQWSRIVVPGSCWFHQLYFLQHLGLGCIGKVFVV